MQTTSYNCAELWRPVRVFKLIEWVSGIGDDDAEPVVLSVSCSLASRCPRVGYCPLLAA